MMTEDELVLLQAEWAKLLDQTAVRLAITVQGDGRGGLVTAGGYAEVDTFPCLAYPHSQKAGDTAEVETGAHITNIEAWDLMTETTVSLNLRDRILVDEVLLLEVSGGDANRSTAGNIVWSCSKVDLGEL